MKKILFDSSTHLGQFCTSDEEVRKGCKNTHAHLSPVGEKFLIGAWTDAENGRTDRAIWNMPVQVQDDFYPYMDAFFSLINVEQVPMGVDEEDTALGLRSDVPSLSTLSRQTCARAICTGIRELHTLFQELLDERVRETLQDNWDITVRKPCDEIEFPYEDTVLEARYQTALKAFERFGINPPTALDDERMVSLSAEKAE